MKLIKEEKEQEFKSEISLQDQSIVGVEDKAVEVQNPVYADAMREFNKTKEKRDEYIKTNMDSAKKDVSYTPKMPKNDNLKKMHLSESLFEGLINEGDSWELDDIEGIDIFNDIADIKYEIDNCVKGSFSKCSTLAGLGNRIKELAERLDYFGDSLISMDNNQPRHEQPVVEESLEESASGQDNVRKLQAFFAKNESLQEDVDEANPDDIDDADDDFTMESLKSFLDKE